jgi:hypothetical protein
MVGRWNDGDRIMKMFVLVCILVSTSLLTSCSKPQHPPIIGRWHEAGTAGVIAFHEDGTVEMSIGSEGISGKYSFITDGKLKLELVGKRSALGPIVYLLTLRGDKLSLTDVAGEKTDYLREK